MQYRLVASYNVSRKPLGSIVNTEDGTDRLSQNVSNYQLMRCNIQEEQKYQIHVRRNL